MQTRFHLCATGALFACLSICAANAQDHSKGDDSQQMAASLLQAIYANNQALTSFDVHVTEERFSTRPSNLVSNFRTKRLLWSKEKDKYLIAVWSESDFIGRPEPERFLSSAFASGFSGKSEVGFSFYDERRRLIGTQNPEQFYRAKHLGTWIDHTVFGLNNTANSTISSIPLDNLTPLLVASSSHGCRYVSDEVIEVVYLGLSKDEQQAELRWRIDLKTMLPITLETGMIYHRTKTKRTFSKERFTWIQVANVSVPSKIMLEMSMVAVDDQGNRQNYDVTQDLTFEWLAVNQTLNDDVFEGHHLDSSKAIKVFIESKQPALEPPPLERKP